MRRVEDVQKQQAETTDHRADSVDAVRNFESSRLAWEHVGRKIVHIHACRGLWYGEPGGNAQLACQGLLLGHPTQGGPPQH